MARTVLVTDERYPDIIPVDAEWASEKSYLPGIEVDVDQATLDRWTRACSDYNDAQDEMKAARDAAYAERKNG